MTTEEVKAVQPTYVVFHVQGETQRFIGEIQAANDIDAIDSILGDPNARGEYVAVARRYYRVRTVGVENNPKRVIT